MDFPNVTAPQFKASAEQGGQSLDLISDMVTKFANAQNESFVTFKKYEFGKTLNPGRDSRTARPMHQNAFNALFKSELIKVRQAFFHCKQKLIQDNSL